MKTKNLFKSLDKQHYVKWVGALGYDTRPTLNYKTLPFRADIEYADGRKFENEDGGFPLPLMEKSEVGSIIEVPFYNGCNYEKSDFYQKVKNQTWEKVRIEHKDGLVEYTEYKVKELLKEEFLLLQYDYLNPQGFVYPCVMEFTDLMDYLSRDYRNAALFQDGTAVNQDLSVDNWYTKGWTIFGKDEDEPDYLGEYRKRLMEQ